ncbi:hypothetical protein JAAARDRAFT_41376 [Jaapia argillacea MUCL 33604]|uniref:YjgF-like protein n=1 Tax=Jaapia argillacea MUCL 33604 TaxID=933084 RepID=A0A067P8L2_9AGAM|nr:hypothetical protein JAAARDRAFT_41376 [Jaapia argillacea MUCL 33604]
MMSRLRLCCLNLPSRSLAISSSRRSFVALAKSSQTQTVRQRKMSSLSVVSTPNAPAAIGPYSQAITLGNIVFVSGCIPIDPATGDIVPGGIEEQAEQALKNLGEVVRASGSQVSKVAKTTVFLKNMNDFGTVNGIYAKFFGDHKPARSLVEVARLPKDVLFEIECIASL